MRLRILLITPWFYPAHGFGGTVQRLFKVSKYLASWGHEVTVLTTDAMATGKFDRLLPVRETVEEIRVYRFHVRSSVRQLFFTPTMIRTALKKARDSDIVHACGTRNFQTDLGLLASILGRKPLIIQGFASVPINQEPGSFLEPFLKLLHTGITAGSEFRLADSYIAASKFEKEAFMRSGVPLAKIATIPSGADLDEFRFEHEPKEVLDFPLKDSFVLFVGRVNVIKGLDVLVSAFKIVSKNNPSVKLVLAGVDQGFGSTLVSLIDKLGLAGKVHWIRDPSRVVIALLMRSCEFLVLPSYSESNPIVIHEAGACAKAVIASNVGGIPELISDGVNGLLVQRGDVKELSQSITYLLDERNVRDTLGRNLQKQVYSRYNWESVARETEKLYAGLVRRNE